MVFVDVASSVANHVRAWLSIIARGLPGGRLGGIKARSLGDIVGALLDRVSSPTLIAFRDLSIRRGQIRTSSAASAPSATAARTKGSSCLPEVPQAANVLGVLLLFFIIVIIFSIILIVVPASVLAVIAIVFAGTEVGFLLSPGENSSVLLGPIYPGPECPNALV